ncbi:MFS general substrate transporter [Armillaria gallica]|uniref:MFS general substrate transporter n=1 Tax=Armillaria gallica TaxID=47427 RepID=A0A2H3DP85_ARMGA|nr:MFS general substrate transporter [Armillaria gallica]
MAEPIASLSAMELECIPRTCIKPGLDDAVQTTVMDTTNPTPSLSLSRRRAHIQFTALWWNKFLKGWNDGSNGALLPRMQTVYNVNYAVVSLIFIMACVGFVIGALINVPLMDRIGFGKVLVVGALCQAAMYALQAAALPFPVFVTTFAINGIGMALQDAQVTSYVASLRNNSQLKMMILQVGYGGGALTAPLVATQFAQMEHWSFFYLLSLGIAISNTTVLSSIFRFNTLDVCFAEIGEPQQEHTSRNDDSKFRQLLRTRTVHLLGLFSLVYVGTEVTIGGWIVTFIQRVREGGPSSGYISSGFFAGLTIGPLVLLWVTEKLGNHPAFYLYSVIAIGLELVIWFVPSLIADGVAVALVGLVLGPTYPLLMSHAGRVLPQWLLSGAVGWIAGLGQAGSALFPFMTGAVANAAGIDTMPPLLVGFLGLSVGLWALVPKGPRRAD